MTQDEQDELLIEIRTIVKTMEHRLFGNGQPGEIDKLHALEAWKNRISGAIAILSAGLMLFGGFFIKHLWSGK